MPSVAEPAAAAAPASDVVVEALPSVEEPLQAAEETFDGKPLNQLFPEEKMGWRG